MDKKPMIRLVFVITKNDENHFDRNDVDKRMAVEYSKNSPPVISRGKLNCDDISQAQRELSGITIIPSKEPPYQMILHAYWSIELPKTECWSLNEPLLFLEQMLCEKRSEVLDICKEYDLSAELIIRVFAESNNMPELSISQNSVSFWASLGATISFDFYLD